VRPFWWNWPSWAVELPTGVGVQSFLHWWGPTHHRWLYWLAGAIASVIYELWMDRHGWAWRDVLQRGAGQVLGELAWRVL
jgi:hypothetical protein